jgi:DNA-binding NtrC family response regulator
MSLNDSVADPILSGVSRSILIIEDEDLLRSELVRHYRAEGWHAEQAANLAEAKERLAADPGAGLVVVSDMNLPDGNALDLLEEVRARKGEASEWIFLSGYGTIPDSVRALRLGAIDFLEKPCPLDRLDLVVAAAERSVRAHQRLEDYKTREERRFSPDAYAGTSAAATRVREMVTKLAGVPFSSLVIGGETGTGKGLVARILHSTGSRAAGPMVEVNCAALPSELLESELFGHEAGAFTGAKGRHRGLLEQANQGTLFLDEIGEMSLPLQAKLLTAIEDRVFRRLGGDREIRVDIQVIAASNRSLAEGVAEGRFREDLYHRLSVVRVDLPPLRERIEDLDVLVPFFVAEFNAKAGKRVSVVSDEAWRALRSHAWRGNVRELRNVIERCVLFAEGDALPSEWLQLDPPPAPAEGADAAVQGDVMSLPLDGSMALDDMERFILETALERSGQNVAQAARSLGMTRQTLRYRIGKYGLRSDGEGGSEGGSEDESEDDGDASRHDG